MRDHKAVLSEIDPNVRTALTERSDVRGLAHLALYLGLLAGTSASIALGTPFWPLFLLPQGILLTFLFTLSHECTHKTPFRTGWLNECSGRLAGLPLLLPFEWFRFFHLAHHRYTQDPARDPELAGSGPPKTWPRFFGQISGVHFWAAALRVLWQNAFATPSGTFIPKGAHAKLRREARVMLALYSLGIVSLIWTDALIWLWLIPALIGQPFLRLYLLAEHSGCLHVGNMLVNTRTVVTNPAVRFLSWNMPFHAEHHVLPQVPFHRLPELHRLIREDLVVRSPGYVAFTADAAGRLWKAPDRAG